jgi:hypothetical protein
LRLAPLRPLESMAIDEAFEAEDFDIRPPWRNWPEFKQWFLYERDNGPGNPRGWMQGQHLTAVARTQFGKTTLIRELLPRRDYVVMLATKREDPIYAKLQREDGFELVDHFDPNPEGPRRVIFKPPLKGPGKADQEEQAEAFRDVLTDIYREGGWCVWANEIRYLTETLKLQDIMNVLWMQGATLGVTMVAETQRPVSIPVIAFDANHLFYWKTTNRRDVQTMTEFVDANADVARFTIPRLPKYETLYIDTVTDQMARTKVSL